MNTERNCQFCKYYKDGYCENLELQPCYPSKGCGDFSKREALEREPILNEIRAEIEQEYNRLNATRADETLELGECLGLKMALKIINKYKGESEGE